MANIELELYNTHLGIVKDLRDSGADPGNVFGEGKFDIWFKFVNDLDEDIYEITVNKQNQLKKKFASLKALNTNVSRKKLRPTIVDNFVINLSTQQFDEKELNLLNKGLGFSVTPNRTPIEDVIFEVEAAIQYKPHNIKHEVRKAATELLQSASTRTTKQFRNQDEHKTLKKLKSKPCYYMKADKGNALVILDKSQYDEGMNKLIHDGPYEELKRNPLPGIVKQASESIGAIKNVFGERIKWKLIMSNPSVPRAYGLPKIHKRKNETDNGKSDVTALQIRKMAGQ